jgi:hypothetical protein
MDICARLYNGELLLLDSNPASLAFVQMLREVLGRALGTGDLQTFFSRQTAQTFPDVVSFARGSIRTEAVRAEIFHLLAAFEFETTDYHVDLPRLRVSMPESEFQSQAAIHRDVWFGEPHNQLNFWVPLYPVTDQDSLAIWPAYFQRGLANSSVGFDADKAQLDESNGQSPRYPEALERPDGAYTSFALERGQMLVFSANHLHASIANKFPMPRISVDFRVVHIGDYHSGRGPILPDNASVGSSLRRFRSSPFVTDARPPTSKAN